MHTHHQTHITNHGAVMERLTTVETNLTGSIKNAEAALKADIGGVGKQVSKVDGKVDLFGGVGLESKGVFCTYLICWFFITHVVSSSWISPGLGGWDPEGGGCVSEPCHGGGWGRVVVVESVAEF